MSTGRDDIILDQRCADCNGAIMVAQEGGWREIVQHVDAEDEADHSVRHLTLKRTFDLKPYDPSEFDVASGSFAGQGMCSFARFGGQSAEWMTSHQGRSGRVRIGLCHEHAVRKVGGERNLPVPA